MKAQDHRFARFSLLLALLGLAWFPSPTIQAAASSRPAQTVEIGELGHQVNVLLEVGDSLRVVLPANPSTGYGWQIAENNSAMLREAGSKKLLATKQKPGAPGRQSFTFTANAPGKDRLLLNYSRPWEKNAKPARTYAVEVKIERVAVGHQEAPVVTPAGTLLGVYGGKLPCADCSEIRTNIAFYATGQQQLTDTYYVRTMIYVAAPAGNVTSVDAGNWLLKKGTPTDPRATVYSLQSNQSDNTEKYQLRGDTLIPLGNDDKPIQSPFNMDLHKQR